MLDWITGRVYLRRRLEKCESAKRDLSRINHEKSIEIQSLSDKLSSVRADLDTTKDQVLSVIAISKERYDRIVDLEKDIASLQSGKDEAEERCASLETQISESREKYRRAQEVINDKRLPEDVPDAVDILRKLERLISVGSAINEKMMAQEYYIRYLEDLLTERGISFDQQKSGGDDSD